MIQRFKNSWELLECSIGVLSKNLKLLVFPFISLFAVAFIFLFFLGTFLFQPTGHGYTEKAHWKAVASSVFTQESIEKMNQPRQPGQRQELQLNNTGMIISVGIYFLAMFLATFFNVAFYHEIMEALNGRPVGIAQGFRFAMTKIHAIFFWSMLAGIVGYLIKQLEQRMGFIGKIFVNLIGLAWSVAAVFAIPVIVCEENVGNPINVLKSSALSIRKTWGEALIGFTGIQLGLMFALLTSFIPFVAAIYLGSLMHLATLVAVAVLAWVLFIVGFMYFGSVASNVFQCALYVFASSGAVPPGYTREMMDLAWKHKKA